MQNLEIKAKGGAMPLKQGLVSEVNIQSTHADAAIDGSSTIGIDGGHNILHLYEDPKT